MKLATRIPVYRRIKADPAQWFEPAEVKKAKDYQRPLNVARIVSLGLNLGLLLAIISTKAIPRLLDGTDAWTLRLIIAMAVFTVAFTLIDIPVSWWTEFTHEQKWGFSTQTPAGFVSDLVKGLVVAFVIQTLLLLPLYWLMRTTGLWWLFGWLVFFGFSVVLATLYPVLIMPLFNKFTPLEDADLGDRLRALAEGVGMRVGAVQVMDASKRTRKDNAFFAGLGGTRRVVLFDNLLQQPHPVVASVVAHELGHWRRRHVARNIAIGTLTSLLLFVALRLVSTWDAALDWAGVETIADAASLPLVLLTFVAMSSVTGLVQAWFARAYERQADLDALEITKDHDAFELMERGLSTRNLIDLAPTWWRYIRATHPPPAERLELGRLWRESVERSAR